MKDFYDDLTKEIENFDANARVAAQKLETLFDELENASSPFECLTGLTNYFDGDIKKAAYVTNEIYAENINILNQSVRSNDINELNEQIHDGDIFAVPEKAFYISEKTTGITIYQANLAFSDYPDINRDKIKEAINSVEVMNKKVLDDELSIYENNSNFKEISPFDIIKETDKDKEYYGTAEENLVLNGKVKAIGPNHILLDINNEKIPIAASNLTEGISVDDNVSINATLQGKEYVANEISIVKNIDDINR